MARDMLDAARRESAARDVARVRRYRYSTQVLPPLLLGQQQPQPRVSPSIVASARASTGELVELY